MTAATLAPQAVAATVLAACMADVDALKPGNVGRHAPGHGMTVEHFLASARAIAPVIVAPASGVGQRILRAVEATIAAAGCNTNLGIVLLAAPLVHAVLEPVAGPTLRDRLAGVLATLTVADAEAAYAAIRLAQPAGLGRAARGDVAAPATMTLLEAMQEARDRDRIALQYATAFADLFDCALPWLRDSRDRHGDPLVAVTACFLEIASTWPDSHVLRKHGTAVGEAVRARVGAVASAWKACENRGPADRLLLQLDAELKREGVNPGTSADLTVGALITQQLEILLDEARAGWRAAAAPDIPRE